MDTNNSEKQRENLKAAIEAQLLHSKRITEEKARRYICVYKLNLNRKRELDEKLKVADEETKKELIEVYFN